MSPPGKNGGRTTNESVVKAIRGAFTPLSPPRFSVAWSSKAGGPECPKPGKNSRWMRSAVNCPPLP